VITKPYGYYISTKIWFANIWFYGFHATLDLAFRYYSVGFSKFGIVINFK
jgi:hypothetical protein